MLDRFRLLRKISRVTLGYDKVLATTLTLEYTQARIGYRALTTDVRVRVLECKNAHRDQGRLTLRT